MVICIWFLLILHLKNAEIESRVTVLENKHDSKTKRQNILLRIMFYNEFPLCLFSIIQAFHGKSQDECWWTHVEVRGSRHPSVETVKYIQICAGLT